MKTTITTRVTCDIDDLVFGWWDEEREQFVPIKSQDDVEAAIVALGCSEKMLDALSLLVDSIKDFVGNDLRGIWARLDATGI